jgi:hypothetical protein
MACELRCLRIHILPNRSQPNDLPEDAQQRDLKEEGKNGKRTGPGQLRWRRRSKATAPNANSDSEPGSGTTGVARTGDGFNPAAWAELENISRPNTVAKAMAPKRIVFTVRAEEMDQ